MELRSVRFSIAVIAGLACAAGPALGAVFPVTGTLAIEIATLAPVTIPGAGTVVVNGSGGGGHLTTLALPANLFETSGIVFPVTDPAADPIDGIQLTLVNAPGTVTGGIGVVPLAGVAKVCLFAPCAAAVANLSIPLSVVGQGGTAYVTAAVNLTVVGAPWTTGTASIGTLTRMGFAQGPGSEASSTAALSGQVRLVTPVHVNSNIGFVPIPVFATMTLHFVPEPGTLLMLAGGLAALAAAGRARMRT